MMIAVGTGTWGIAAVIPKYLSPDFNYKAAGEIWGDAHRRRE